MERVRGPHTAILGRMDDRAAGSAFVAIEGPVAMIHAIEVAPQFRRLGMASWLLHAAANWAAQNDAPRLGLAVSRANTGARAAYDKLGFREVGAYSYWARP
nr:GNAT family N-acetyltransferase [Paracoccus aestuariivivens]